MKKILVFLLIVIMGISLLPFSASATGEDNTVYVTLENTTFLEPYDGRTPAWTGTVLNAYPVTVYPGESMMDAVADAFTQNGITAVGIPDNYISSINGLAAFDGGSQSGWMGTLNGWFTNVGFGDITVAAGDVIQVMYTCAYGVDLGGTWYNNDKSLIALGVDTGTLSPAFSAGTLAYTLTLPSDTNSVTVTPVAANKNFQVRVKNETESFDSVRWGTRSVAVTDGGTITVTCGDPMWPSMNNGEPPMGNHAELVPAVTYTIAVEIESDVLLGDVTGDGNITVRDITAIRSYILGNSTLNAQQLQAADYNGDGNITVRDITAIRKLILGL